uniref:Uncharacterized protein n=1 Tax=Cannabis sativa TaxID=3483 RepID=A0A803NTD8_CANSA
MHVTLWRSSSSVPLGPIVLIDEDQEVEEDEEGEIVAPLERKRKGKMVEAESSKKSRRVATSTAGPLESVDSPQRECRGGNSEKGLTGGLAKFLTRGGLQECLGPEHGPPAWTGSTVRLYFCSFRPRSADIAAETGRLSKTLIDHGYVMPEFGGINEAMKTLRDLEAKRKAFWEEAQQREA